MILPHHLDQIGGRTAAEPVIIQFIIGEGIQ